VYRTPYELCPGSDVERLAQIDAWLERLATETDHTAHGAEITRYLTVLARFHRYSAHNCMSIVVQRPDATRVAGYRAWQPLGRQVKKGAKSIAILCPAPIRDKDKAKDDPDVVIALRFRVGYVFDMAGIEGDALPALTPQAVEGDRYADLLRRPIEVAAYGDLSVSFADLSRPLPCRPGRPGGEP